MYYYALNKRLNNKNVKKEISEKLIFTILLLNCEVYILSESRNRNN